MKNVVRLLYLPAIVLLLSACSATSKIKDGNTAYTYKKYSLATTLLPKEYQKTKVLSEQSAIALKIADSYDKQLKYDDALPWYKMVSEARVLDNAIMYYINALKRAEKYDEAYKALDDYIKANRSEKFRLQKELDFLKDAAEKRKLVKYTQLENLSFNTSSIDFAPFVKDNQLYFSSTQGATKDNQDQWTGEGYADLYVASIADKKKAGAATALSLPFNTSYHEASYILSKDGKTAYFTRCGSASKNDNDYCHIYRSQKNIDDTWGEPQRLKLLADTVNEGQPWLSADEKELYFVSDDKNGYGGRDIYLAKRNIAGEFENPVNAGGKINTAGDELFPVIAADNKLYFSTNGRPGYGGLDLYSATRDGKIYTNVQHLGYGINSGGDDFGIQVMSSKDDSVILTGYLTSNRPGGKGLDDIYFFEQRIPPPPPLPPAVYLLKVWVQAKKYQEENNPNSTLLGVLPVQDATIEWPIFGAKAQGNQQVRTNPEGTMQTIVPQGQQFVLKVSKPGYLTQEEPVSTALSASNGDTITIEKVVVLSRIYKDVEITLNNIYYDYDKWDIRADAAQSLDTLVDILLNNPGIKIQLSSHTDCRGKDSYNETLSQKRAESVVQYLIGKGIDAARLTAKGYGETMPIETCECDNCTEAQHQRNRRTTFKILSE